MIEVCYRLTTSHIQFCEADLPGCLDNWRCLLQLLAGLRVLVLRSSYHRLEISHCIPNILRTDCSALYPRAPRITKMADIKGT